LWKQHAICNKKFCYIKEYQAYGSWMPRSGTDRQTDRQTDGLQQHLMPHYGGDIITTVEPCQLAPATENYKDFAAAKF